MRKLIIGILIIALMVLSGCATPIGNILDNPDKYYGKKVLIQGEVSTPLNFGKMQGFSVRQGDKSIMVSSETVPNHGDTVTGRGIVVKGMLMSTYIFADKVAIKETREERQAREEAEK